MDRPKIVLGLGNPGTRYRTTRHNLGFRVLDGLAGRLGISFDVRHEDECWTAETDSGGGRIVLAKPRTYMNRSGRAALALCTRYTVEPGDLLVVVDDADLELGRLRLRPAGGAGGHNGMRSLIDTLHSEDFPRVRLGVRGAGRREAELAEYVLEPFEAAEEPAAEELALRAVEAVEAILAGGMQGAMNHYNARSASTNGESERDEEES